MNRRIFKIGFVAVVAAVGLWGCGEPATGGSGPSSAKVTPDGKTKQFTGKGDAWDWRNDPAREPSDEQARWLKYFRIRKAKSKQTCPAVA